MDDSQPENKVGRHEVYKFEIPLGNWMPRGEGHESYMMFSLCHKMIIGFST